MILKNLWDKAFVISLPHRTDRREHAIKNASEIGIEIEFFDAVNKDSISNYSNLRNGEFALLQSYTRLLDYISHSEFNNSRVLILEDDFEFELRLNVIENEKMVNDLISLNADLIYLGANHSSLGAGYIPKKKILDYGDTTIDRIYTSFGAHSIITTPQSRSNLRNRIDNADKPLDVMYIDLQLELQAYAICPSICKQYDSVSDIIGFNPHYNQQGIFS